MLPLRSQKGNATQEDLFEAEKKTFVNKQGKSIFYMVVMSCLKGSKGAERHGKDWRGRPSFSWLKSGTLIISFWSDSSSKTQTSLSKLHSWVWWMTHPFLHHIRTHWFSFFFFSFLAELAKFFFFTVTLPTFHYCGGAQGEQKHTLNHKYGLIHTAYTQRIQQKAYQSLECCYKPTED